MMPTAARALSALLFVACCAAQATTAEQDWTKHVDRACTSPRYGLRLAAAKKVGQGGEAAMPAVRAWEKQHGINTLPVALVEAIADHGGDGEGVLGTLQEWASNHDFYWRAQALRGLAIRAQDNEALRARFASLFLAHVEDPAWLMRTFARWVVEDPARDFDVTQAQGQVVRATETDPRARTKLATLRGDARELFSALGDARTFLGDPWGKRRASEAIATLKALLGTDGGYRIDAPSSRASLPEAAQAGSLVGIEADNAAALLRLADAIAERDSGGKPECARLADPPLAFLGGIEIQSCKHGDYFLHWTADGLVRGGPSPDCPISVQIAPGVFGSLLHSSTTVTVPVQSGVVVCDKMRIHLRADVEQAVAAPAALPDSAADWLKQLAAAIEVSGQQPLADALRLRLGQFVMPAKQAR